MSISAGNEKRRSKKKKVWDINKRRRFQYRYGMSL